MDLAGVAALLGVPAAVAAVVLPIVLEGRPLGRLERLESILQKSTATGGHRLVLEDARNRLAAETAFAVLVPRLWFILIAGPLYSAWGALSIIASVFIPGGLNLVVTNLDNSAPTFWSGLSCAACGILMLWLRGVLRRRIWSKHYSRGVSLL